MIAGMDLGGTWHLVRDGECFNCPSDPEAKSVLTFKIDTRCGKRNEYAVELTMYHDRVPAQHMCPDCFNV